MMRVLRGLTGSAVLVYLDDVCVLARDPQDMVQKLKEVFERFRQARLRIHPSKCHWAVNRVRFLGHEFSPRGVEIDQSKFAIVRDFPVPKNQKQVRSFNGLTNYYRRFIKGYSQLQAPLRALLKKDAEFVWTPECQKAFEKLKEALITAPVLALPDFNRPFILTTDACTSGIAYILGQRDEGGREHPVCYGGRGLRPNEEKWTVSELEALAVVEGVKNFHCYLAGNEFECVTDHITLTYIQKMKLSNNNRLARWALFLQGYKFKVTYKKGETLTAADAISRIPGLPKPGECTDPEDPVACAIQTNLRNDARVYLEFEPINETDGNTINAVSNNPEPPLDLSDLKNEIRRCPDFASMVEYLEDGKLPADDERARKVLLNAPNFELLDGDLIHLFSPRTRNIQRANAVIKQLCIPTAYRPQIAFEIHDRNAHLGFDRAYATARSRFYFPGMYTFFRDHVLTCPVCQQAKRPAHPGKTPTTSLAVPLPGTRWHIDHHTNLPMSADGRRHVLVIIDSTSMWPELIAVESTDAETVVRALFDNVVSRFGIPRGFSLLSDNGSAFISELTSLFCKTFRVRQIFTTPYHPQTNARAEEFADTLHNALRTVCSKQADWPRHLQAIAMAYRAAATTNTGLSPYEVLFGKPMPLSIDWAVLAKEPLTASAEHYAREVGPKLEALYQVAVENATRSAARHASRHDRNAIAPNYAVGDKVLLRDQQRKRGRVLG
jgi:transposase InsO family protein